ncbi:hypothetical protein [Nitrosomonas sp. Is37]|uniref:hypothetical protein n=1 Tax=Nitrosomonas sp. Is37 TaxID=3080535 RepID=UPI00294AE672|nr:hypothetical protein [Nitrosomonas sp. Is37]MDV6343306.1 hypothetical protein [Nitrosomonas sp. Is37]
MDIDRKKSTYLTLGILFVILLSLIRWGGETLQYLFYLRVPLISGALLFMLPIICIYLLPSMLGNLFVLKNKWRMSLVIPGAVATGLGIVIIGGIIGTNAAARFNVSPCPLLEALLQDDALTPYLFALILAFPTAWAAYWSSGPASKEMSNTDRKIGVVIGSILSLLLMGAIYWARTGETVSWVSDMLLMIISILPSEARAGLVKDDQLTPGLVTASAFLAVSTILYLIGLLLYRPKIKKDRWQLPALSYVLGLLLIFSFLFGLLTFVLDYYRVPVLLSFLAVSALAYKLWKVDHYYDIRPTPTEPPKPDDFIGALKERLAHQQGRRTLVVVCASGGGIQAAGWTSMVLTGLQKRLGKDFTQAIGLISSVSGGSVGTLHFLDRFGNEGAPEDSELNAIFNASTEDSLGATGWGLVYPDLWRFSGLPFLHTQPRDRGAAIETDWKSFMKSPNATLRDWVDPIKQGKLPVPVFNATIVEDGRHYLISPMTFATEPLEGLEFNRLYPQHDMDASTAALLSATFPYVTPITRNSEEGDSQSKATPVFHVADGGFFDNFGIVSAVDWLNEQVLPKRVELEIERVLLVEIRAFPDEEPLQTASRKNVGFLMSLFGPLLTVLAARNSTQAQRNEDIVNDLKTKWTAKDIDIFDFKISFPKNIPFFEIPTQTGYENIDQYTAALKDEKKAYTPPLSWTLTKKQKDAIRNAWEILNQDQSSSVAELEKVWSRK